MDSKKVKDLMVPLDQYAVVPEDATLLDAIIALDKAQKRLPVERQPYRAVLVADKNGAIIGKIGQLAFLTALEPKYNVLGDLEALSRAGVRSEFITSMMEHYQFFQESLPDHCLHGRSTRVKDVMRPVKEAVQEETPICEAIHKVVMLQTLSILVKRGDKVTGLLRLSDLFDEVVREMKKEHDRGD